jgi:hypothetical protein
VCSYYSCGVTAYMANMSIPQERPVGRSCRKINKFNNFSLHPWHLSNVNNVFLFFPLHITSRKKVQHNVQCDGSMLVTKICICGSWICAQKYNFLHLHVTNTEKIKYFMHFCLFIFILEHYSHKKNLRKFKKKLSLERGRNHSLNTKKFSFLLHTKVAWWCDEHKSMYVCVGLWVYDHILCVTLKRKRKTAQNA